MSRCAASEDDRLTAGDVERSPGTIETIFLFFSIHANVCSPACGPRLVLTLLPRCGTCSASCLHSPSRPPDVSCCAILQYLLLSPAYICYPTRRPCTVQRLLPCLCTLFPFSFRFQLFCSSASSSSLSLRGPLVLLIDPAITVSSSPLCLRALMHACSWPADSMELERGHTMAASAEHGSLELCDAAPVLPRGALPEIGPRVVGAASTADVQHSGHGLRHAGPGHPRPA